MTGRDDQDAETARGQPSADGRRQGAVLRLVRRIGLAGILTLAVLGGGFAWFAGQIVGMSTPPDPRAADAIIVLTGGHSRIEAAVELLRAGKGKRLLISGVNPVADINDLRRATGGDRKLFACCVDIDHAALDTIGNAEESAKWLVRHAYDSAILVTNNYHMPRSMLEMRRRLAGAELQPYPVVNTRLDDGEWITNPQAFRVLLTEYVKYVAALARGVLQPGEDGTRQLARQANTSSN
ncbi:MAG: YdcF family protein [Rhizobiaceae bacterium]|nr:YdcF family protein [Rhizobiaceae bacterium]